MFRGKKMIQSKLAQLYNKHLKVLRHVSILTDHHQGIVLYLVKVTE